MLNADVPVSTLNNPNVSANAKEHAKHVLEDQFNDVIEQQQVPGPEPGAVGGRGGAKYGSENVTTSRGEQRNRTNVVRGYKAYVAARNNEQDSCRKLTVGSCRAVHNPSNTEQGRQHARSALEEMGVNPDE